MTCGCGVQGAGVPAGRALGVGLGGTHVSLAWAVVGSYQLEFYNQLEYRWVEGNSGQMATVVLCGDGHGGRRYVSIVI